ncbi:phenylalanine--tRNA ligase subunit beta [Propionibacteriaceae bacterium G1746]|uniref:phenylalanine--tRNA ligase subunit beta n=1 Tax=Aestuariimicrobium sp. G57 TaxID=3418485 RepID=UPI003C1F635F
MKLPVEWLRSLVTLPEEATTAALADRLTAAGVTVEKVHTVGGDVTGPVVIGRVLSKQPEPQKNGKTINWCRVDVGPDHVAAQDPRNHEDGVEGRGVICGADNFEAGDLVVVALPGAVLPGDFAIAARKTYGHVSDGMICAADELGIGDDHDGIIVVARDTPGAEPGADALDVLGARGEVFDLEVTTDMGYCLSARGLAREAAQAYGVRFNDPYRVLPTDAEVSGEGGHPVVLDDPACPLFVTHTITGVDPTAPTPAWMSRRLEQAGMRSISVVVDVTNYVMLESGQPLHAYDADRLSGAIVVRKARAGEKLTTLDDVERTLADDDLLITDDSGPIGLAGVMGGQTTEVSDQTANIVLESAHFDANTIGRGFRRHRLPSEASKRFDRGVDVALPQAAGRRAAELIAELAGGEVGAGVTIAGGIAPMPRQTLQADLPQTIMGFPIGREQVISTLEASGVHVTAIGDVLTVVPPTWRPDLVDAYDYVEEVGTKLGYENIPSATPPTTVGSGLTGEQRNRRAALAAAVGAGFVEQISLPFLAEHEVDKLGVPQGDPRHAMVKLANPLDDTHPYLRTTLLPGLLAAVTRNTSRSNDDLALFEAGRVFIGGDLPVAPNPGVAQRPGDDDLAAMQAALPDQPRLLAAVVTGQWHQPAWSDGAISAGEAAGWPQVVALTEHLANAVGVTIERRTASVAPWHPGRCAELLVNGEVIGVVGELHPGVIDSHDLPARTAALELDLDALVAAAPGPGTIAPLSPFPVAKEDVALVVDADVAVEPVRQALVDGAGELLEEVHLFDIYTGPQVPEGKKSLAFAMRFRGAATLTDTQAAEARDAAVAVAAERFGAVLRS